MAAARVGLVPDISKPLIMRFAARQALVSPYVANELLTRLVRHLSPRFPLGDCIVRGYLL
jgi:hypothetical protein